MAGTRPSSLNSPSHLPTSRSYARALPPHSVDSYHRVAEQRSFSHSSIERDASSFAVQPNAHDFEVMLSAFMWSGGIVRTSEAARHLQERQGLPSESLESLLASRAVFAFDWAGSQWLPMFQFDTADMSVNADVYPVITELGDVFDGWALACWFLEPNLWLQNRRPLDVIESKPWTLATAARGDRYIATDSWRLSH